MNIINYSERRDPQPALRVYLCGEFTVERRIPSIHIQDELYEAIPPDKWGRRSHVQRLFTLLLTRHGQKMTKAYLLEKLWPDTDIERSNQYLNVAVSKLYKVLRLAEGGEHLLTVADAYYTLSKDIWVDSFEALAMLRKAQQTQEDKLSLLEQAVAYLDRGTFLAEEDEQWALGLRASMEERYHDAILGLVSLLHQQGHIQEAELRLRTLLEVNPLDEEALCHLLLLLYREKQPHKALRCYESFKALAMKEGVEVLASTTMLVQAIRHDPQAINISSSLLPIGAQEEKESLGLNTSIASSGIIEASNVGGQILNRARRNFMIGAIPSAALFATPLLQHTHPSDVSEASIANLEMITQQYREMQLRGDGFIETSLHTHISVIHQVLENTLNTSKRAELWRVLAKAQLVARLGKHALGVKTKELTKILTLNEAAIASAQHSRDSELFAAATGHLAHLYLREYHNTTTARELLEFAQPYIGNNLALAGWFAIVLASIAAKEGRKRDCEAGIDQARMMASQIPQKPEYHDPYYTNFSCVSVETFAGNCYLDIGEYQKAYELLVPLDLQKLPLNRYASTFYDRARLYAAEGDMENAEKNALKAIDYALAAKQCYIIERCTSLACTLQRTASSHPQATTIRKYASAALEQMKGIPSL